MKAFKHKPQLLLTRCLAVSQAMSTAAPTKPELRKHVRQMLKQLTPEQMAAESTAVCRAIKNTRYFQQAQRVGIYVHCEKLREVDPTILLDDVLARIGCKVYVPVVKDNDANMHLLHIEDMSALISVPPFGIFEPTPHYTDGNLREEVSTMAAPLDLLLMPGLAFDRKGGRLGRGGGYYDKFIDICYRRAAENGWKTPLLVALSYEAQIVDEVPMVENDVRIDILVTASDVVACSDRGIKALQLQ